MIRGAKSLSKPCVSVIVPIYNVEKYLDRCLKSIVNQTLKNIEIILVDDGSQDSCPKLCDDWEQKDDRIRVVHKKNAGLGYARNTGIDNATGEYICFFDSDDYIEPDTIEKAYNSAIKNHSDLVLYGFNEIDKNGNILNSVIPKAPKYVYEEREILDIVLPDLIHQDAKGAVIENIWMSASACMYSNSLIENIKWRFVTERVIISEDIYSLLYLYKYVNRVSIIPEAFYNYCENDSSLTRTFRKDRFEKISYFYRMCDELCRENEYPKKIRNEIKYPYIANILAALKMIVRSKVKPSEKIDEFKVVLSDNQLQMVLKDMDLSKEYTLRKIILSAMKRKRWRLCYILIYIKTKLEK